jgi:ABC-type glycerol-3-phosphate transport system permease component
MMARAALVIVLGAGVVVMAFPFVWMLGTAFKTAPEAASPVVRLFPEAWQWGNVATVLTEVRFARYFYNTFLVAGCVTAAVVATSLGAGYAFARLRFPGKGLLFAFVLATMMVPFEVMLIPNYVLITRLGWYNTYAALIVPWCANAFAIFLVRQAFLALPGDFFDAARVDGCGHFRFLARVGAPMVQPALMTAGLFAFLGSYNALIWPLVVTADRDMRVVQVALTFFTGEEGEQLNLMMCAAAIVMAPTVVLYFFTQRYFMETPLQSGIKG